MRITLILSLFLIVCIPCFGQITDFNFLYYNKDQGLPDNRIYDFQEDLKGRIWISTETGVSCFDGSVFKNYIHPLKESDIAMDWVGCHYLTLDSRGRIWEATTRQLFYFDEKMDKFIEFDLSKIEPEFEFNNDSLAKKIYLQDWNDENSIWFRKGNGIYAINSDDLICKRKLYIPVEFRSIWGLLGKDLEGNIIVGGLNTAAITIFRLDGSSFTTRNPIPYKPEMLQRNPDGSNFTTNNRPAIVSMIFQPPGIRQYWVGGSQLMSYDKSSDHWEKWSTGATGVADYAGITTIPALTGDTVLWMYGHYHTVVTCFNTKQKRFLTSFQTDQFDASGLRCGLMYAMFVDSKSNIWFGGNAGVSALFSSKAQFERYLNARPKGTVQGQISTKTKPEPFIGGTWKMPDGSLAEWVADGDKLYYIALSNYSKAYFEGKKTLEGIEGQCTFIDLQTGLRTIKQLTYQKNTQDDWIESNPKSSLAGNKQPLLYWPATNNKIITLRGEKFEPEKDLSGTWFTSSNNLVYLFQDGDLFVCMHPVHIMHGKIMKNSRIQGLEVRWWGGCRTEMEYVANIITSDSMLTSIKGLDTNCDLKKGYTGGGSIKRFLWKEGKDTLFIHTFRIFDKIQPLNPVDYQQKTFELDHDQNFISFEFDCANPVYPILWYKLIGFDHDWFQTRTNKSANYTNLDGGNYTFNVKATTENGLEMGQTTTFRLHVIPPYYRTWWFYGLCFVLGGLIFYGIFRYREIQRLRQEQLRLRIARDLHDEVGSTLSSISILSESALLGVQKDLDQARFGNIGDKARTALESISDIVWSINPKNDSMSMVLARMSAFASEILEGVGTELQFKSNEEVESLTIPMGKRKDFYLLFKEAINNCAKYAHAKNVEVKLEKHGNTLCLNVKDDGVGFDIQNATTGLLNLGGNGLQNMCSRAKVMGGVLSIHSVIGTGTEIQLDIPIST